MKELLKVFIMFCLLISFVFAYLHVMWVYVVPFLEKHDLILPAFVIAFALFGTAMALPTIDFKKK